MITAAGSLSDHHPAHTGTQAQGLVGLGAVKNGDTPRMLILMDIEDVMSSPDMGLMDQVAH